MLSALVAGLGALGVALALVASGLPGAPTGTAADVVALVLLLGLAAFLGVEFRAAGHGNRVDLFDAALAAALLTVPGLEVLLIVLVAKAFSLAVQQVPFAKTCFNLAQWSCAAAAGSLVVAALREPGPAGTSDLLVLPVALVVVAALNNGAVLLVLSLVGGRPVVRRGARSLPLGIALGVLGNLLLGAVVAALWTQGPAARPAVPLLLVAVHLATRLWAQRQTGAVRLAGLQRAAATLAGPGDLPTATAAFLEDLRQAFDCAGAQLRLLPGHLDDGGAPTGRWVVSGPDRRTPAAGALLDALVERGTPVRLAPPGGDAELLAALADAGWRDCLASPVRCQGAVVGVLCTHDRAGWEGFEEGELAVLEAAAGVLGEAMHRDRLAAVLRDERAALQASEARWRAFAGVLEMVTRDQELPATLDRLARTVDDELDSGCCALVVRLGDAPPVVVAAPGLPPRASAALERVVRQVLDAPSRTAGPQVLDLSADLGAPEHREALLAGGIRLLRTWRLPCSIDSDAAGVLVLCGSGGEAAQDDLALAAGAARVGGLAVDHVLVRHRLAHQAGHDSLTDLPNRGVFHDRLRQSLRRTERSDTKVLVIFLDLDRFKVVNDSLGHRAGDALLCAVAERLRSALRPGDTVARFGGDEFTMLCEGIADESHALRVVQRVQDVLSRPFPLGEGELFATASIGIAVGHGATQVAETLVEDADAAMYRAKERGGNCYELFDTAMRERAVERLATSSALHRAVERGEFRVVYQPTVRLATGQVDGVEALVRWDRPGSGTVSPAHFVPLAEETGLIVPIGAFVLEQACQQARQWQEGSAEGPLTVSVNLSARQLLDPGLVPLVEAALERSGTPPSAISLEITESVLMADVAASGSVLADLKSLGVRLYVDDFGTGYSSLTYLQRFPVDGIKVDRSFVAGLGRQSGDDAIVRAVIGLAHGLGLVAVAEGVETQEQADHLVDLRCDVAQGYHFGRPGAADLVRA